MGTARAFHCTGRQGRHALAQLHGRVRELLHRSLIATLVLSALLLAPRDACAQLPSAAELASDDDAVRAVAIARLSSLPASALPEITARLAAMRRARPPREQAVEALAAFRHATGSRRADDLADLAQGVPAVLAERRDRDTIRMAEALLLLRSLEAIETTEALALVPEVLRLDGDAWRMEGRRVTLRHGDRIAAASILARAHDDAEGREWARWSSRELGLEPPGRLVQRLAPRELADVLRAWGRTRAMDAMAVVASYVDAEQRMVREAAREALESYGQHALWQSREAFRARLGEDADLAWGWRRTLDELVRRLDSRRFARVDEELAEAREALAAGQLDTAERALAALLAHTPDV